MTRKNLKEADKKIRVFARAILHLNPHCHSSIMHAPVKEGGLGLLCFAERIPGIMSSRVQRLRNSDTLYQAIMDEEEQWVARITGLVQPVSGKAENYEHYSAALNGSFSGCDGLRQVNGHRESSRWVYDPPPFWTGEEYIKAIQLRFNMLPCKAIPSNPVAERRCRADGCRRQETICHILQACNLTHSDRIQRHNFVQDRIAAAARGKGWEVHAEKHIYSSEGLRKPNLILVKGPQMVVSDIGVHWEGEEPLATHHQQKIRHYSTPGFMRKVVELLPSRSVMILPYIIGARGGWCAENQRLLSPVDIGAGVVRETITGVIKGGIMTHAKFMRCVWE